MEFPRFAGNDDEGAGNEQKGGAESGGETATPKGPDPRETRGSILPL